MPVAALTIAALMLAAPASPSLPAAPTWIAPTGITADSRAAAIELLDAMGARQQMRAGLDARLDGARRAIKTQLPSRLPSLRALRTADPAAYQREIEKAEAAITVGGAEMFRTLEPKLMEQLADLYARKFSAEELRGLTAFFRTPLGRRYRDTLPGLNREASAIAGRVAREQLPLLLNRLAAGLGEAVVQPDE